MKYDLIIKNGNVVTPEGVEKMNVFISDGRIVAMSDADSAIDFTDRSFRIIDAEGMYVMPGVIDAHVHLCEPGRTDWEGFETGTKALAAGGVTCYFDMPLNNLPAVTDGYSLNIKKESAAGKNYVDYALYGGLVQNSTVDKIHEQSIGGVIAYKCFVATCGDKDVEEDFSEVDDYTLIEGMRTIAKEDKILSIHCENRFICDSLARKAVSEGRISMMDYLKSRPVEAEVEAVKRVLYFSSITGCRVHFVHLSCAEAIDAVFEAIENGLNATIETCPHYLLMDSRQCVEIGTVSKCSPPIRDRDIVEKLWERVISGKVNVIASDHSPCPPGLKLIDSITKKMQSDDVFKAWGGISACQSTLELMFDEGVKKRGMKPESLMRMLSYEPARIFGVKSKGSIAVGKDADIVILDPEDGYVLSESDLFYRHKISPYVGRKIGCRVKETLVRGVSVYEKGGKFCDRPIGKFVKP